MSRYLKNRDASMGQIPGEPIFIGEQKVEELTIHTIDYDSTTLNELHPEDFKELFSFRNTDTTTWINIYGLHNADKIRSIAEGFDLHPLVIEDILYTGQRPKIEEYDDYLFFVIKMMRFDREEQRIVTEQLSIVMGSNYLLTFQERPGDVFEPVRNRIRKKNGRIRNVGVDYLTYSLLDTVIDNYILIVERMGEEIEEIEEEILDSINKEILIKIIDHKREMNYMRRTIQPAREFILHLSNLDSNLIQDNSRPFLKDLLDLSIQAVETVDTYRDMLSDNLDIYNTLISNRLNEIMKILTIFSAIFIPLTFIAGIYGTNFEYLPELGYHYSYFIFLGVLLTIAVLMIGFFKRKKWL